MRAVVRMPTTAGPDALGEVGEVGQRLGRLRLRHAGRHQRQRDREQRGEQCNDKLAEHREFPSSCLGEIAGKTAARQRGPRNSTDCATARTVPGGTSPTTVTSASLTRRE